MGIIDTVEVERHCGVGGVGRIWAAAGRLKINGCKWADEEGVEFGSPEGWEPVTTHTCNRSE